MKIYIAVKSYWPEKGGIQTVTKYMAEGLAAKGHAVTILTERSSGTVENEVKNGVSIFRFHHKAIFKLNFGDRSGFQKFILDNISEGDVLVNVCAQSFVSEWCFPLLGEVKAKKILYMHGMREEKLNIAKIYSLKNFIKELILTSWWKAYFKQNWCSIMKYDACIHLFENDSSYHYFNKHGYNKNYCIENSCDSVFFSDEINSCIPKKYGINGPYFLLVANYDENKNQEFALDAFVEANIENYNIVFIGSRKNKYSERLEKRISSLDTKIKERIFVFTGIERNDTIQMVKNCYACLLSSHSEYFPISLVEGMASQKPFISTSVGEVPKFIGGHVVKNVPEMAYWMRYYANNPDCTLKTGEEARKFACDKMQLNDKIDKLEKIIIDAKEE